MDRVRFITHQGKRILLVDLTNCSAKDVMKVMAEVQRIVDRAAPPNPRSLWVISRARSSAETRSPA